MKRTVFLPIISIDDDGNFEAEWSQSYSGTQDMDSPTFDEVDPTEGDLHCVMLNDRLDLIRDMLATKVWMRMETGKKQVSFMELVRPFFEEA